MDNGNGKKGRTGRLSAAVASSCRSAGAILAVLVLIVSSAALAGQHRATFRVGLRIDAALLERDLQAATGTLAAAVPTSRTRTTSRNGSANAVSRLRRADGSGWCVKVRRTDGRARWRCD